MEIIKALPSLPKSIETWMTDYFSKNMSAIFSNVAGPREEITYFGHKVKDMIFWAPSSGEIGLNLSLLSYQGALKIGVFADENTVKEPEDLIDLMDESYEELMDFVDED